ncbi:hypothetical protein [Paenibacillus dakarensis]|uniref:hypothetical protein n=1 Tax=Paenibacillus dakarensis TaxID=1527293 RepID=UPI0006D5A8A6|nr:hypothetical protein [Paenibacillus dakarensis]
MEQVKERRKRRKKSKKPLWITLIVLLVLGGAGWGGFYYLTHKDIAAEDIGVDQDFFDFSEFDLEFNPDLIPDVEPTTDGKEVPSGKEGDPTGKEADKQPGQQPKDQPKDPKDSSITEKTPTASQKPQKPGKENVDQTKPAKPAEPAKPIDKKQEIENKYSGVFERLESVALSKLDTLAEKALKDYRAGRSLVDISSTYMSAANKLQDKVDGAFYIQLDRLKADLKANGLDNELAKKAESSYKAAIASKKNEMMEKVTKISGK